MVVHLGRLGAGLVRGEDGLHLIPDLGRDERIVRALVYHAPVHLGHRERLGGVLRCRQADKAARGSSLSTRHPWPAPSPSTALPPSPSKPSPTASGAYAMLVHDRDDAPELVDIHRFRNPWEKTASLGLRHDDNTVIDAYATHQRISEGDAEAGSAMATGGRSPRSATTTPSLSAEPASGGAARS